MSHSRWNWSSHERTFAFVEASLIHPQCRKGWAWPDPLVVRVHSIYALASADPLISVIDKKNKELSKLIKWAGFRDGINKSVILKMEINLRVAIYARIFALEMATTWRPQAELFLSSELKLEVFISECLVASSQYPASRWAVSASRANRKLARHSTAPLWAFNIYSSQHRLD